MTVTEHEPTTTKVRTVTTVPTVSDLLNHAANILEHFGWCQHQMGSREEGAMCMSGAIMEASKDGYTAVVGQARNHLIDNVLHDSIATWNDAPGRTKHEVITKLRQAANEATK